MPAGIVSCRAGGTSLAGAGWQCGLRAQGPRGESCEDLTRVGVGWVWCGGCSERQRDRGDEDEREVVAWRKESRAAKRRSSEDLPL